MVLCLGEPPRRFLWYWLSHLIFISSLYLHFWSSFCRCSSFAVFLHSHFLFDIISHTSVDYLLPFYTVSPAHRRVICNTFIFNHSVIFLPRALRFWVGVFYPQVFFTLRSFTGIYQDWRLSRPPWELEVLPWSLQGFILILKTQTRPICLFDSK